MEGQFLVSCPGASQVYNLWQLESILCRGRFAMSVPTPQKKIITQITRIRKHHIIIWTVLLLIVVIVLLASGSIVYPVFSRPSSSDTVGHAFFFSSGLINTSNNQGTTDELHISLRNIDDAQPGKRYYGWLTSNSTDMPVALGPLTTDHGQIVATYNDPNHTNLLAHYNRLLITEESADQLPVTPSLNINDWHYAGAFSTTPNPTDPDHFSLLDHLRHLLALDPKLEKVGLQGGLGIWLYRNTTKILEAAGSARDTQQACRTNASACDTYPIFRQIARILDYLDGAHYVSTENIPPAIQGAQLLIDPTIAQVALLEFDSLRQQPPGYLEHIGMHLRGLIQSPGATSEQRALASRINQDMNNVQGWLEAVHTDAATLMQMSASDLSQPAASTVLNDLFHQANTAFVGQIDPNTNQVKEGVTHIYYNVQALATLDVVPCTIQNGQSSCATKDDGE